MNFSVVEDWDAAYPAPIHLDAGERFHLTGRRDIWDGHIWLWAVSAAGLEGWIPDSLVGWRDGETLAKAEYTAVELTCRRGQALVGEQETHGWVYCRSADGAAGWVPRKNLIPADG